jgi:hypothetical protein
MKLLGSGGRAAVLMAAAILPLGIAAASAQAATASPPPARTAAPAGIVNTPAFTCQQSQVCMFQDTGLTGAAHATETLPASGFWLEVHANTGLTIPWGSFNDDSGSSVVFGDAQTGFEQCFKARSRISDPSAQVRASGFMWIEFGNTGCTGAVGALPPAGS